MRALVTGGYGFAGRHLAHHLVSCGDDVAACYHPAEKTSDAPASENWATPLPQSAQSLALDVSDEKAVDELVALTKPEAIYHLASLTFVPSGELNQREVFDVNALSTFHFLNAIAKHSPETRFLFVSSAEVYGDPALGSLPLNERSELRPVSVYGIAKATADLACFKYSFRGNLHTIRIRPFNHIGPGQADHFSVSSFAKQLAEIKLGRKEPVLYVGNLEAKRDFSDVSDIVRGYREALLNGKRGAAYNLCSGVSIEVGELLQKLIACAEVDVEIVVDPSRVRAVDIADLYGDFSKAQKDFGWKPRIDLEGTLSSIFAHWVEVLEKQ